MTRSRKWGSHLSSVRLRNLWSAQAHHRPKEVESPRKNLGYPGLEYFSCSKYGYGCFGIL